MAKIYAGPSADRALAGAGSRSGARGRGFWRDLDWILLVSGLALSVLGSVLVWSASRADLASPTDPHSYLKRHVINVVVAILLGYVASRVNYRWLRAYTPMIYGISFFLLLLPFVPGIGVTVAGARAWVDLPGGLTLQPSEFMKIAVILMISLTRIISAA